MSEELKYKQRTTSVRAYCLWGWDG